MAKVSLIIAIYNMEKYLHDCLDKVVSQTLTELEIICINDGSTDSSADIIREYAQKDSRFIFIDKSNTGYADSLNIGLEKASGEYLTVLDPDDYPSNDMYEILYNKAKEVNADFVKADFSCFDDEGNLEIMTVVSEESLYNRVITDFADRAVSLDVSTWSGIYKTDFIKKHSIHHIVQKGVSFPDQFFSFQVAVNAQRGYYLDTPLYFYRRGRADSAVTKTDKVFYINKEYEACEEYLRNHPEKSRFYPFLCFRKYYYYKWNLNRINNWSKILFLHRMQKEFTTSLKKGTLKLSMFKISEKRDLILIMRKALYVGLKTLLLKILPDNGGTIMDYEEYFEQLNVQKQINRLSKKYKNKRVVLYGAGKLCQEIFENYDLSALNIVAVADKAFSDEMQYEFYGLQCISPKSLRDIDCDVILISTYKLLPIYDYLKTNLLLKSKNAKVKIRPLVKKSLIKALKDLFNKKNGE